MIFTVKTDIFVNKNYNTDSIKDKIEEKLGFDKSEILSVEIIKKTLKITDSEIGYTLTVAIGTSAQRELGLLKMKKKVSEYTEPRLELNQRRKPRYPTVIGAGPAGLFSALALALGGDCPTVIERGLPVTERERSVERFFTLGHLDPESNIQFGEGGAGAFSDGKLKVGGMDKYKRWVLSEFVSAGADEDILYTVGAHLGTDKLPILVARVREKIISLGGKFIYSAKLTDVDIKDGRVVGIKYDKDGQRHYLNTDTLILATGHSARDTFYMLYEKGLVMQPRGFGIGVRIEHPREYINSLIYPDGSLAGELGTASYHLVTHLSTGRSLYSFCMCPGGTVVAAASESSGIVTNGMSAYDRMADNSNAAHLVSVTPDDFESDHPLAGIELQRKIEKAAFSVAKGCYKAPATSLGCFLSSGDSPDCKTASVTPSYPLGCTPANPESYLPKYITDTMREGIYDFDSWLRGFILDEAMITGPETRSTSPVRILREDASREAVGVSGLYPIGEGAGYAGGIVSSAVDGVRTAEIILNK